MEYTVNQLARLAGISVRTLHYYDEIDLLKPSTVGSNGYRYYGPEALIKLQQILFYRELDLSLDEIRQILQTPGFEVVLALEGHRQALQERIKRQERLIKTVDSTILYLKGQKEMTNKQLFKAFTEEEQEKYADEAEKTYDPRIVKDSNHRWKAYSDEKKAKILAEGNQIYVDLVAAMPQGPESDEVQGCVEHWRKHMNNFWTPNLEQLVGLAEIYNNDPGFKMNFDKIDPRLAEFMLAAVRIYVERKGR
jgi:DNA-binding transcriptional MerR regulator